MNLGGVVAAAPPVDLIPDGYLSDKADERSVTSERTTEELRDEMEAEPVSQVEHEETANFPMFEQEYREESYQFRRDTSPLRQTMLMQPTPYLEPRAVAQPSTQAAAPEAATLQARLFQQPGLNQSLLRQSNSDISSFAVDAVSGEQANGLVSTDLGSLLRKSSSATSVEVQRRTPIVNDPRVRGSRIGSLASSGSYWVPARADLDTAVSKIDSRLVSESIIIPGPYSSLYGPGFQFVDFELLKSPRSEFGNEWHGRSSFDHNSNGNQYLGQQSLWGGGEDWGIRASYSHRTGDNYRTGAGNKVPSGYESREFAVALGRDLGDGRSLEFSLLRLDQTDVEFPGYVFDIDFLVTDAYGITYIDEHAALADRTETELWYNRTVFEGDAQNPAKRNQFPLLNIVNYQGVTDVDSMSTGYRRAMSWGQSSNYQLTIGHDLRFVKQELNEIADVRTIGIPAIQLNDRNSPIPRSFAVNPGLFTEYREDLNNFTFRTGGRLDFVQTDIVDDPNKLTEVGLAQDAASYNEIVGTDQSQTDRLLGSIYAGIDQHYGESLVSTVSVGFAERAPTLTELYAAQPFLLILQNGLNSVTGDPLLKTEKLIQSDITLDYNGDVFRGGVRGFYGWAMDYITLENTEVRRATPTGPVQQVSLRYVNTALATLAGGEAFAELFPKSTLTPFMTLRGVDGRDRTRNGDFATTEGAAGNASDKVAGQQRGFFSGILGAAAEPLPGISPFEIRTGVRLRDPARQPQWNMELAARIVDNQDRVATSLLESTTPGFTVWDIRGMYQPRDVQGLTLVAGLENFTDKAYREHLDFRSPNGLQVLQPGINAYVGVDWTY